MTSLDIRRQADDLVTELRDTFNALILPPILADREGPLAEGMAKEIAAGKKVDLRVPRFLAVSGKGGPGYESWSNVTLFDHATSVGMAAAAFAALDMLGGGFSTDEALSAAALALAIGLIHDPDKLLGCRWDDVTLDDIVAIIHRTKIIDFLARFTVHLTAEQLAVLTSFDEERSAWRLSGPRCSDHWIGIVRKYVRLADVLDSLWLHGLPAATVGNVLEAWRRSIRQGSRLFHPEAFADYRVLWVTDPHHPFLLANFSAAVEEQCRDISGMRPLLHAVRDETLVSLLPIDCFDAVLAAAIDQTAEGLPFDSELIISPAGAPKMGGAKPSWSQLCKIVRQGIPTGEVRRLLSVKAIDFRTHETVLRQIAGQAGCPFVPTDKPPTGQTMPLIRSIPSDDPDFAAVERACLISLAIGVEEESKAKEFSRKSREQYLSSLLGSGLPNWMNAVDPLTRRTALALLAAARITEDPDFAAKLKDLFTLWFDAQGVFRDMPEKGARIREAVRQRFAALARGDIITVADSSQACLVTGEPVQGTPIDSKDGLYGINSSALSYRSGRAEQKFRETAETYLSLASQAEYRLRATVFAKLSRSEGGIAVRLSSPTAGGLFSLCVGDMQDRGEFGLFDMIRANRDRRVYEGLEAYGSRTHLGRFESLPRHFADRSEGKSVTPGRISFFRIAMQAARRYGRPLHLFSGLPHSRREFFYCDCFDPELRTLLGKDGLRLEDLPEAIEKLEIVGLIAAPPKADGLGMADTAKSFCLPATRFTAACLAWLRARDRESREHVQAVLHSHIEREVEKMDKEETVSPPVRLGRLAASIQRRPNRDASAKDETFLIDKALEGALYAYRNGWHDRTGLVAQVSGLIKIDGDRREDGKGFYSAKVHRDEGQNLDAAMDAFAEAFVDLAWFGSFKGRPPSSNDLRNFLAAYRWTFVRSKPKDSSAAVLTENEAVPVS